MRYIINIARINHAKSVDFDQLPDSSQEFVIDYGLKQLLADSIVSGTTDDERHALLEKKFQKLLDGTLAIRTSSERDPFGKELTRLANIAVDNHITKKLGLKLKDVSKEDRATLMARARANEKRIAEAKANVAAQAETDDLD